MGAERIGRIETALESGHLREKAQSAETCPPDWPLEGKSAGQIRELFNRLTRQNRITRPKTLAGEVPLPMIWHRTNCSRDLDPRMGHGVTFCPTSKASENAECASETESGTELADREQCPDPRPAKQHKREPIQTAAGP